MQKKTGPTTAPRVTYIHQYFKLPEESGGTRSYEFAKRLVESGFQVTVITGGDANRRYVRDGIRVEQLNVAYENNMKFGARVKSFMRFMVRSSLAAAKTPADVVFATSTPLTVAIPGVLASKLRRVPFVFEVRDLWPSVPAQLGYLTNPVLLGLAQALERWAYSNADRVIALSPAMRDGVLQTAPRASVTLIPNASDFEIFSREQEQRENDRRELGWERPVVAYAGSFGAIYRIPWLVELATKTRGIDFHIMGAGAGTQEAERIARQAGLDVDKLLPGALPKLEVARRIAAADIVISTLVPEPALEGSSLNKVFDAMAAGRPMVFNHDGWLSELATREGAGFRLSDDVDLAAEQLSALAADGEKLRAAGKRAYEVGRAHFDRNHLYATFEGVLRSVLR